MAKRLGRVFHEAEQNVLARGRVEVAGFAGSCSCRQQLNAGRRCRIRGLQIGRREPTTGVQVVQILCVGSSLTGAEQLFLHGAFGVLLVAGAGLTGRIGGWRSWRLRRMLHCHIDTFRVAFDVGLHALLRVERVIANGAFVHFFAVVRHLVQLQHVVVAKGLSANFARVWLFPSVRARVDFQLFAAGEALLAHRADIGLFTSVRAHVDHQLSGLDEGFGANGAFVRTLSRVDSHVAMELARMLERSGTNLALVRALFRVDAPMDAQVLLHAEALVAELAPEGLLPRVGAVVPGETCRHGECLGANVATVRVGAFFLKMGLTLMRLEGRFGAEHFAAGWALLHQRCLRVLRLRERWQWQVGTAD